VFEGQLDGARAPGDVTVFKSVGLGIEDVAAAAHLFAQAEAAGIGTVVAL